MPRSKAAKLKISIKKEAAKLKISIKKEAAKLKISIKSCEAENIEHERAVKLRISTVS